MIFLGFTLVNTVLGFIPSRGDRQLEASRQVVVPSRDVDMDDIPCVTHADCSGFSYCDSSEKKCLIQYFVGREQQDMANRQMAAPKQDVPCVTHNDCDDFTYCDSSTKTCYLEYYRQVAAPKQDVPCVTHNDCDDFTYCDSSTKTCYLEYYRRNQEDMTSRQVAAPSRDFDMGIACVTNSDCVRGGMGGAAFCSSHKCWLPQFMGRDQQVVANRREYGERCENDWHCPAQGFCHHISHMCRPLSSAGRQAIASRADDMQGSRGSASNCNSYCAACSDGGRPGVCIQGRQEYRCYAAQTYHDDCQMFGLGRYGRATDSVNSPVNWYWMVIIGVALFAVLALSFKICIAKSGDSSYQPVASVPV